MKEIALRSKLSDLPVFLNTSDNTNWQKPEITYTSGYEGYCIDTRLHPISATITTGWGTTSSPPITKETKGEDEPMKNLYEVIVVDKQERILTDQKIVAQDEDEAKFNADVSTIIRSAKLKPKDVTVLCRNLGQVKVEKEVQKVKLIKDDE